MTAIIIILAAYFLPTLVAGVRSHRNGASIFIVNLFLGWTLLGWVLALAWSLSANVKSTANYNL